MIKSLIAALAFVFVAPVTPVSKSVLIDSTRVGVVLNYSYTQAKKDGASLICLGMVRGSVITEDPNDWEVAFCMNPEFEQNFDELSKRTTVTSIWPNPPEGQSIVISGRAVIFGGDWKLVTDPTSVGGILILSQ